MSPDSRSKQDFSRRTFLKTSAAAVSTLLLPGRIPSALAQTSPLAPEATAYLESIAPTAQRVKQFTEIMSAEDSIRRSNGWTYDSTLGWIHCPAVHPNGVDGSKTYYSYEPDGARKVIHHTDQSCRIHAYGNSFTHCDQVSDGETWEEYLAAHLREPIRNYGVGGFSVYQAYRRMQIVEANRSAEYIILNIFEDDHYRNLDAWRSIRVGAGSSCGFTLPHLRVNLEKDRCEPVENLLATRNSVAHLRDASYRAQTFGNDPILKLKMALKARNSINQDTVRNIATEFGYPETQLPDAPAAIQIRKIHTEAALFATSKIIEWTEDYAQQHGKKLMLLLSFGRGRMKEALTGKPLFDQTLITELSRKTYPVIDLRDAFGEAYRSFKGSADEFLAPHYNGHHTPRGNFFTAWAIKGQIVRWLNPAPAPYRE